MNHFDIRLTDKELDYIANVLAQRPWGEVNSLLTNIKEQVSRAQEQHDNGVDSIARAQELRQGNVRAVRSEGDDHA